MMLLGFRRGVDVCMSCRSPSPFKDWANTSVRLPHCCDQEARDSRRLLCGLLPCCAHGPQRAKVAGEIRCNFTAISRTITLIICYIIYI